MSATTITRTKTRIEVVRHHNRYFYNRAENGRYVVHGELITAARARDIIAANAQNVTIQTGMVRFDAGNYEFSWTAEIVEEGSDG